MEGRGARAAPRHRRPGGRSGRRRCPGESRPRLLIRSCRQAMCSQSAASRPAAMARVSMRSPSGEHRWSTRIGCVDRRRGDETRSTGGLGLEVARPTVAVEVSGVSTISENPCFSLKTAFTSSGIRPSSSAVLRKTMLCAPARAAIVPGTFTRCPGADEPREVESVGALVQERGEPHSHRPSSSPPHGFVPLRRAQPSVPRPRAIAPGVRTLTCEGRRRPHGRRSGTDKPSGRDDR